MRMRNIFLVALLLILLVGCREEPETFEISLNPGQDTVNLGDVWVDAGAVVDVGGAVVIGETTDTVDTDQLGVYVITYQATYEGTDYDIIRYVIVTDLEAPTMSLLAGIDTITVGDTWFDQGVVVFDNLDDNVTIEVIGTVDNTTVGDYIITYKATDDYGNISYIERIVSVIE